MNKTWFLLGREKEREDLNHKSLDLLWSMPNCQWQPPPEKLGHKTPQHPGVRCGVLNTFFFLKSISESYLLLSNLIYSKQEMEHISKQILL